MDATKAKMTKLKIAEKKESDWGVGCAQAIVYRSVIMIVSTIMSMGSIFVLLQGIDSLWDKKMEHSIMEFALSILKGGLLLFVVVIFGALLRYQLKRIKYDIQNYRLSRKNIDHCREQISWMEQDK